MDKFKGLGVAMITPFRENGEVDFNSLQKLTQHLIDGNVDYLVVHGTTGESATLSSDEKRATLDFVLEVNNGKLPVVLGVGGNDTRSVIGALQTFDITGVDGILSVSPYYNKPTQEGIFQHFKAVCGATDLPVILYNVPGRTASNMSMDTTLRLAHIRNAVAVKEASGDMEQIMHIINHKPDNFLVLSGDDAITLPILAAGGDGVISVVGNAFPLEFSSMVHACLNGNYDRAREHHYKLLDVIQYLFVEGNPGGVKEVLKFLNICQNHVRLPLANVSKETSDHLYKLIAEAELAATE